MNARSEPLLWLQLLGLAAVPLEVLLLVVLFAGADPGPLPSVERLICWALGVLLPALVLWRRPPDVWSLLLLQVPAKGRRPRQQRLSRLQSTGATRLLGAAGAALLLPLTWWADRSAGVATGLSPFAASGRLVVVVLAIPVLAVLLWQWQQLIQVLWLFSREDTFIDAAEPLNLDELEQQRLCLGLPLLLLDPLESAPTPAAAPQPAQTRGPEPPQAPAAADPEIELEADAESEQLQGSEMPEAQVLSAAEPEDGATALGIEALAPDPELLTDGSSGSGVAVDKEQPTEDPQGGQLDPEI